MPTTNGAGVLVGLLRVRSSVTSLASAPTFRTLWLVPRNDRFEVAADIRALIVPRRSGFWRVGILETCTEANDEDWKGYVRDHREYLSATPVEQQPAPVEPMSDHEHLLPCRGKPVACENNRQALVRFVWPDHVSVNVTAEYACGAHPDADVVWAVRRIDDLGGAGNTISEVLGAVARQLFQSRFETAKQEHLATCDVDPAEVAEADERNWIIERKAGRWQAMAWGTSHRLCGGGFDVPIDIELPANVVGRHGGERVFTELHGRLPGFGSPVNDVHEAPGGDLFVATTGPIDDASVSDELLVFRREATIAPEAPLFRASSDRSSPS